MVRPRYSPQTPSENLRFELKLALECLKVSAQTKRAEAITLSQNRLRIGRGES
jgi:hypothetical protein